MAGLQHRHDTRNDTEAHKHARAAERDGVAPINGWSAVVRGHRSRGRSRGGDGGGAFGCRAHSAEVSGDAVGVGGGGGGERDRREGRIDDDWGALDGSREGDRRKERVCHHGSSLDGDERGGLDRGRQDDERGCMRVADFGLGLGTGLSLGTGLRPGIGLGTGGAAGVCGRFGVGGRGGQRVTRGDSVEDRGDMGDGVNAGINGGGADLGLGAGGIVGGLAGDGRLHREDLRVGARPGRGDGVDECGAAGDGAEARSSAGGAAIDLGGVWDCGNFVRGGRPERVRRGEGVVDGGDDGADARSNDGGGEAGLISSSGRLGRGHVVGGRAGASWACGNDDRLNGGGLGLRLARDRGRRAVVPVILAGDRGTGAVVGIDNDLARGRRRPVKLRTEVVDGTGEHSAGRRAGQQEAGDAESGGEEVHDERGTRLCVCESG